MAGEIAMVVVGNLVDDPELRFTQDGTAVLNFTVANNTRYFSKESQQWENGETTFVDCVLWGPYAENIVNEVNDIRKGRHVIVQGTYTVEKWTHRETGENRYSPRLKVTEFGTTLRFSGTDGKPGTRKGTGARGNSGNSRGRTRSAKGD